MTDGRRKEKSLCMMLACRISSLHFLFSSTNLAWRASLLSSICFPPLPTPMACILHFLHLVFSSKKRPDSAICFIKRTGILSTNNGMAWNGWACAGGRDTRTLLYSFGYETNWYHRSSIVKSWKNIDVSWVS